MIAPKLSRSALAFAPARDTGGKRDATGAFIPEARAFLIAVGAAEKVKLFDNTLSPDSRRDLCEKMLLRGGPYDTVALFCHGTKNGLQAGWRVGRTARSLAVALNTNCTPNPVVALYCCDAGKDSDADSEDDVKAEGPGGEGGFADALRDECRKVGLRATVYAHASTGHTTFNPFVRVFLPDEAAGGRWIIVPHSRHWSAWRKALRTTSLRFRFPFMTQAEIESELRAGGVA